MRNHWIFQLESPLSSEQKQNVESSVKAFLQQWKAHGAPVSGYYEIRYDRFVILKANPGDTSGCSIDAMRKEVSNILTTNQCKGLENNFICYKNENSQIVYADFNDFEKLIGDEKLNAQTIVFDVTMGQTDDLNLFEVPLKQTWLNRYLPEKQKA